MDDPHLTSPCWKTATEKEKGATTENPKFSKEQIGLSKAEATAELRWLVEESGGNLFTSGKPYPAWMKSVLFPAGFKRPDLPTFKGSGPAKQHLWHFTMQIGGLLEKDAQRVMLFTSTLE